MSQPRKQDLTMKTGDMWNFTVAVDNAAGVFDLTGATVWFTVKRRLSDADPGVLQVTSADDEVDLSDGDVGLVAFTIGEDKTKLPRGRYHYEVQIQKPAWAGPKTTQEGYLTITDEVNRDSL